MSRYRCAFSYYGGKSRLAHMYPAPKHDIVVEPFAGGASYSLMHHERQVILNDLDDRTASIWRFLLSPDALDLIVRTVPASVNVGDRVSDILPDSAPPGLVELLRAEANQGTQGARGVHESVTGFGKKCWHRIVPRLEYWLPRISHWQFTQKDFADVTVDGSATWFVDPPYCNDAGRRYRIAMSDADFARLRQWIDTRDGHIIVCENEGATWLPFTPLAERRGMRGRYQKSRATEMVYEVTR